MVGKGWKNNKIRHQWQKNVKHPTVSRKTGLDYPYDKSLKIKSPMPFVDEHYLYIGESNDYLTQDHFYRVVDIAHHWYDDKLAVFVATDEFPETDDTDYCWAMAPQMFIEQFSGKLK